MQNTMGLFFNARQVGDWTEELFRLSLKNPQMPLWITTAQPSVLERTSYYDNGECRETVDFTDVGPALASLRWCAYKQVTFC